MLGSLRKLFAYDDWANRAVLANLRSLNSPPIRPLQLLAHVVGTQDLWWRRMQGQAAALAVWPELTLDECGSHLERLCAIWSDHLTGLTQERMRASVTYVNSAGERWSSTIEDILWHVVMHGAYHRGQIATHLRNAGHTPAYTDFIHATRQGLVE